MSVQDKSGKETKGFKSRMGSRGAAPRLLRLKPEDLAHVGSAPLQKGKFTWVTESGREERWIVASCGNYTVLWNFRCAASGRCSTSLTRPLDETPITS